MSKNHKLISTSLQNIFIKIVSEKSNIEHNNTNRYLKYFLFDLFLYFFLLYLLFVYLYIINKINEKFIPIHEPKLNIIGKSIIFGLINIKKIKYIIKLVIPDIIGKIMVFPF